MGSRDIKEAKAIDLDLDSITLAGILTPPEGPRGTVIFAHGSGSSRFSPRNRLVARYLQDAGLGTLLFDLLAAAEDAVYENRFDIGLLARRLKAATERLLRYPEGKGRKIGYFGASTGSAAALQAAAELGPIISAVVSRGGRPDLAERYLPLVGAPTLLIVGEYDEVVLRLNRTALGLLAGEKRLSVVPRATHLFEEPGALDEVAKMAGDWFVSYLT